MLSKSIFHVGLIALAGCAAEQRTIYFLPVDPVVVAPREHSLPRLAEVEVADERENAEIRVVRGSSKQSEVVLYPGVAELIDEIVTATADTALDSFHADRHSIAIECSVQEFNIGTRREKTTRVLDVFIQIALRSGSFEKTVSGSSRQTFPKTLLRKDFQDVIHAALEELADEVTFALQELGEGTST
jgi:uncharacterized lipoprotein YajG